MKEFIKITNQDIFTEIQNLKKSNREEHAEMIACQIETNGRVKLNRWIATTALTLALLAGGIAL